MLSGTQEVINTIRKAFTDQNPGVTPLELRLVIHHTYSNGGIYYALDTAYQYRGQLKTHTFNLRNHGTPNCPSFYIDSSAFVLPEVAMDKQVQRFT